MPSLSTSSRRARRVKRTQSEPVRPSAEVWAVLERLGVDPVEHFARLLLDGSGADEKRKDEAAKQLLPYCYARRATQASFDDQGQLVGYVLCEG
jgi:hypothetical protein